MLKNSVDNGTEEIGKETPQLGGKKFGLPGTQYKPKANIVLTQYAMQGILRYAQYTYWHIAKSCLADC